MAVCVRMTGDYNRGACATHRLEQGPRASASLGQFSGGLGELRASVRHGAGIADDGLSYQAFTLRR
jgi:hypothetical protein